MATTTKGHELDDADIEQLKLVLDTIYVHGPATTFKMLKPQYAR